MPHMKNEQFPLLEANFRVEKNNMGKAGSSDREKPNVHLSELLEGEGQVFPVDPVCRGVPFSA